MTARQKRFVEEYLIDLNATAAYKRAGYKATGRAAENAASRLLGFVGVAAAIAAAQAARSQATGITVERVLRELACLGFSDARKLLRDDGTLKPVAEWTDDSAAFVASVEVMEEYEGQGDNRRFVGYTKKLKLWDKNSALEKIARHLGMFIDRVELRGQFAVEVAEEIVDAHPPAQNGQAAQRAIPLSPQ